MKNIIIEIEIIKDYKLSQICQGGFKDKSKNGALRICDHLELLKNGMYKITRRWLKGEWDDNLYPTK